MFKRRRPHKPTSSSSQSVASIGSEASSQSNCIILKSCLRIDDDDDNDYASSDANSKGSGSTTTFLRPMDCNASQGQSTCVSKVSLDDEEEETKASSTRSVRTATNNPRKPVVRFQNVKVREYERVIGDNPSCSRGAPVS